jgi:hypothetical protein
MSARIAPSAPPFASWARRPLARTVTVVDTASGLREPEPYRWMIGGEEDPEFVTCLRGERAYAARELAKLSDREALQTRLRALGMGVFARPCPRVRLRRCLITVMRRSPETRGSVQR